MSSKRKTFADLAKAEFPAPAPARPPLDHPRPPDPPKTTQDPLRPSKQPDKQSESTPAPARDFNRRANSLDRDALPSGLFPGSSKKLYDALYLRTRGAVVPVKTISATRRELGKWAGIKNIKTVAGHLRHLETVGLLVHRWERGSTEGSTYEVRLPEEAGIRLGWSKPTQADLDPPETTSDQKLGQPLDRIPVLGGLSQIDDSKGGSEPGKTSFKTKERSDDDEAFAGLRSAAKEITGREAADWSELDKVLVAELRIAAARTTVSSVPAFLAEHLRRRLWKVDKRQAREEGRELPDSAPAQSAKSPQDCPDCKGSGWWYPEGPDKGVAKCKHEKLGGTAA